MGDWLTEQMYERPSPESSTELDQDYFYWPTIFVHYSAYASLTSICQVVLKQKALM